MKHKLNVNLNPNDINKGNLENIRYIIIRTLFKTLKERDLYVLYKTSIAITTRPKFDVFSALLNTLPSLRRYQTINCNENLFYNCCSIKEMSNVLNKHIMFHEDIEDKESAVQTYIGDCVNILIRYGLERTIGQKNANILGEIGQDVFNEVCELLYGEGFEDKTPKAPSISADSMKKFEELLKQQHLRRYSPMDISLPENFNWSDLGEAYYNIFNSSDYYTVR